MFSMSLSSDTESYTITYSDWLARSPVFVFFLQHGTNRLNLRAVSLKHSENSDNVTKNGEIVGNLTNLIDQQHENFAFSLNYPTLGAWCRPAHHDLSVTFPVNRSPGSGGSNGDKPNSGLSKILWTSSKDAADENRNFLWLRWKGHQMI